MNDKNTFPSINDQIGWIRHYREVHPTATFVESVHAWQDEKQNQFEHQFTEWNGNSNGSVGTD